METLCLA
jgi:hypothetical protein